MMEVAGIHLPPIVCIAFSPPSPFVCVLVSVLKLFRWSDPRITRTTLLDGRVVRNASAGATPAANIRPPPYLLEISFRVGGPPVSAYRFLSAGSTRLGGSRLPCLSGIIFVWVRIYAVFYFYRKGYRIWVVSGWPVTTGGVRMSWTVLRIFGGTDF